MLKKNKNYWDKTAKTNIDQIIFTVIPDDTTLMTALRNGQIDFCVSFSDTLTESIRAINSVNLLDEASMGITYITFNTARKPFNDINVRRAISYAIDLDTLHSSIIKDAGIKGSPLPMTDTLFTIQPERWQAYAKTVPPYEFNIAKAKEYMAKSSVPNGFSCNVLTTQASTVRYNVALVLQQMLKAININVEVISVTMDEFFSYMFGEEFDAYGVRDYDMMVAPWGSDYPDPSGNLDPLYASASMGVGGSNSASYSNPKLDALLSEASTTLDQSRRVDLLLQACDIIVDEMPYYIITYPKTFVIIGKNYDYGNMSIFSAWDWSFKDMVYIGK